MFNNTKCSLIITHLPNLTFFFFLTLFLLVLPLSGAINSKYSTCATLYSCGQIQNISYPFWGGDRPDHCGVPEFKLNCLDGDELPTIGVYNDGDLGLHVKQINTTSHTMLISRKKLLQTCYMQDYTSKASIISPLHPNTNHYNATITLFYGCNIENCKIFTNNSKSFPCINKDTSLGSVHYLEHTADEISRNSSLLSLLSSCSCKNNVSEVPVDEKLLKELRNLNTNLSLWDVLTESPVEMVYKANIKQCSECKDSGGRCGSASGNRFMCYCINGAHSLTCSHLSDGRRKLVKTLIPAVSVAGIFIIVIMMILIVLVIYGRATNIITFLWKKRREDQNVVTLLESYGNLALRRYTYAEIRKMTNSFKDKLGEGGYGVVYKGRLHDGRYVAVKKLKILKEDDGKEFINEVLSISRTNHVNIVTLLGYCFQGNKRALVFEYLHNGSLEKYIHDRERSPLLKFETMFNIAVGIAKGLDYLHRGCNTKILHFDIKPHNILLDEKFHPKISDFGLARLCPPEHSMISMSEARGTIGYIAPEVFSRHFGCISHKSDVYSYGMMLLDLVFGRKNTAFNAQMSNSETYYFPDWVYNRLDQMTEEMKIHGNRNDDVIKQELERKMILVSLWCIQTDPSVRPPMNKVIEMLEGSVELLQMPPKQQLSLPANNYEFDTSLISSLNTT